MSRGSYHFAEAHGRKMRSHTPLSTLSAGMVTRRKPIFAKKDCDETDGSTEIYYPIDQELEAFDAFEEEQTLMTKFSTLWDLSKFESDN